MVEAHHNDLIIFEALAESVGLSEVLSKRPWHHFFAMDHRIEAVCRLLMEETEDQCARGGVYFESPGFGIRRTSTGIFGASSAQRLRHFDPVIILERFPFEDWALRAAHKCRDSKLPDSDATSS